MFVLDIVLTSKNLEAVKRDLLHRLPDVKSSHRCEALARGLGFQTFAAARAAAASVVPKSVRVNGAPFRTYLSAHGFEVKSSTLFESVAKIALLNVSDRIERLTMWGMGIGESKRRADGRWETTEDRSKRFASERDELRSDYAIRPFLLSLALLHRVPATKTIRRGTGSYFLKHIAEKYSCTYPEGEPLGPHYVPNGALIAAAIHAGFKTRSHYDDYGQESLNVGFNMSKPAIEDLDAEIRPDGRRSQVRKRPRQANQKSGQFAPKEYLPRITESYDTGAFRLHFDE